jgi:hypothetical protein
MREDRNLVATNLVSVGEYLNGFVGGVFEELEWEDLVSDVSLEMTKVLGWKEDDNVGRYAEMMVLARRILGIFDFKEHLCRSSCSLVVVSDGILAYQTSYR